MVNLLIGRSGHYHIKQLSIKCSFNCSHVVHARSCMCVLVGALTDTCKKSSWLLMRWMLCSAQALFCYASSTSQIPFFHTELLMFFFVGKNYTRNYAQKSRQDRSHLQKILLLKVLWLDGRLEVRWSVQENSETVIFMFCSASKTRAWCRVTEGGV